MGLLTFVPRGGFLYTMTVPGGGFLLPSNRVPVVCLGGMVLDETCIMKESITCCPTVHTIIYLKWPLFKFPFENEVLGTKQ